MSSSMSTITIYKQVDAIAAKQSELQDLTSKFAAAMAEQCDQRAQMHLQRREAERYVESLRSEYDALQTAEHTALETLREARESHHNDLERIEVYRTSKEKFGTYFFLFWFTL